MLPLFSLSRLPALRRAAQRAAFSTIPVEHVARVVRMHVGDEATAVKADAVFQRALGEIKAEFGGKGGVSATRTVCKSEWEYEVEMVFQLEAFQAYMESDFREKTMQPILAEMQALATNPDTMYMYVFGGGSRAE
jgi:hypothetical protein